MTLLEFKSSLFLTKIPFSGNKDVLTGEELGSNLDATLASAITSNGIDASKVTIYYSTNGTATKTLTLNSFKLSAIYLNPSQNAIVAPQNVPYKMVILHSKV